MLSNYTGKVDLRRVREGLDHLQAVYRQSGFSNVNVTLPEQKFTNGLVRIKIVRNQCRCGIRFGRGDHKSFPRARKQKTDN